MPDSRRSSLVLLTLVASCLGLVGGCGQAAMHSSGTPAGPAQRVVVTAPRGLDVRVEPAAPSSTRFSSTLVARIDFAEGHVARMGAPVQGRVASVNVVTGDHVSAGQLLVVIHSPDIAAAQAQVAQARTARVLADQTARRAATLEQQGAGSDAERQQAESALNQARDEEVRTVSSLSALGGARGMSDYSLRAPIAGTVVERNVTVGAEVHTDQDTPLIVVADLSVVWAIADVYEQDVGLLHVGEPATVDAIAYPGRHFDGTVRYVGDLIDPTTRTAHARVELPNPDSLLRPGMLGQMVVVSQDTGGAAEIPVSAVLARRDQYFVFVKNADGSFTRREVELGDQQGQHVPVLHGLAAGELVVTEGAILLDAEANQAL